VNFFGHIFFLLTLDVSFAPYDRVGCWTDPDRTVSYGTKTSLPVVLRSSNRVRTMLASANEYFVISTLTLPSITSLKSSPSARGTLLYAAFKVEPDERNVLLNHWPDRLGG
jgi:hypothetical protein